ncbi:cache domain-containing protein [Prauserella rugosa]|uniref:Cache domain-containing protein n=1 Tax=Prauserella rugosa TaxID=43354 RepID=A0A660CD65_9PSEU|nr:cache domain-containing protein [Prauserella rugosa]KID29914.1 hypothetical protein HQ32_02793 [Prauserella sp. Am3]TWH18805.1 cache domain-containing protein [Prauserella rugosa]
MTDDAPESLRRSAERVRARVDTLLADLDSTATEIVGILARGGRPPRRADLAQVKPPLLALLDRHRGFAQGVGLAFDEDHLADAPRWMEWWRSDDGEPAHFVTHELDPQHHYFYDYASKEWFSRPQRSRRPAVTGPFVDFAGTNEHTVTMAVPVAHPDGFVDVLGADVAVEGVERLLLESVRSGPADTVLLNDHDRVVASTSARWWSGTLLRRDVDAHWAESAEVGGDVGWRLVQADV